MRAAPLRAVKSGVILGWIVATKTIRFQFF